MIQREVALRICAAPGSSDYGAFSVFCQYHTQPELLFEVGPECFLPAPKVTSAVIRLVPRSAPPQNLVDDSFFFQVVRASFAQRRKTLLNGLSSAFPPISGASGWVSLNLPLWPPPSRTVSEPVDRAVFANPTKRTCKNRPFLLQYS